MPRRRYWPRWESAMTSWLVAEDFDSSLPHCLDPATGEEQAFVKVGQALVDALHRRGADTTYPRTLPHRLRSAGLADVGASGHLVIYHGGSPEAVLQQANPDQVGALPGGCRPGHRHRPPDRSAAAARPSLHRQPPPDDHSLGPQTPLAAL